VTGDAEQLLARLDLLAASIKDIRGRINWQPSRPAEAFSFKAELEIDGDAGDGLLLSGRAHLGSEQPEFILTCSCHSATLARVSLLPRRGHTNGRAAWIPSGIRFMRFEAGQSRVYRWSSNRRMPYPHREEAAEPAPKDMIGPAQAIAYMLSLAKIRGHIPPPPSQGVLFP
jgi:hypothetical protein